MIPEKVVARGWELPFPHNAIRPIAPASYGSQIRLITRAGDNLARFRPFLLIRFDRAVCDRLA